MERTVLREAFFAETHRDPFAHMVTRMYAQAWADGYEQALRDAADALGPGGRVVVEDMRLRKSFSERQDDAVERLTSDKREAEARMVIAMADFGRLAEPRKLCTFLGHSGHPVCRRCGERI